MTTVSIGVQDLRMRIGEKAKADPQHRFWGLYTHVWKLDVLREALRKRLHVPIAEVVKAVVNPMVRGWVNYFRWGNAGRDLSFVHWQVDKKVRLFASRQRPKRRGGRRWTTWSADEIYKKWGLYSDYHVSWCSEPSGRAT